MALLKLNPATAQAFWLVTWVLSATAPSNAQSVTVNVYPLAVVSNPSAIILGPDNALWFTELEARKIGRITTAGITEYVVPDTYGSPYGIAAGTDGAIWFTEYRKQSIGRLTLAGAFSHFTIPMYGHMITAGPDGALWFTGELDYINKIGRITSTGQVTEHVLSSCRSSQGREFTPHGIAVGADNSLWFAESDCNSIGRITTAGVVTEYPLPTFGRPWGIAAGPDGALWYTSRQPAMIGRITTNGAIKEYSLPDPWDKVAGGITVGPDGALWFTRSSHFAGDSLWRITTAGVLTTYSLPGWLGYPDSITSGPDNALWFTEPGPGVHGIGRAFLGPLDTTKPVSRVSPLPATQSGANFPVAWSGTDKDPVWLSFTIYVSEDGGPFNVWLMRTPATRAFYSGAAGHTYAFYTIATDWAENQEDSKTLPEAFTQVNSVVPGDLNGDGRVNCSDLAIVKASLGKRVGDPGFDLRADVNGDGAVDVRDLSWESQKLAAGTACGQ